MALPGGNAPVVAEKAVPAGGAASFRGYWLPRQTAWRQPVSASGCSSREQTMASSRNVTTRHAALPFEVSRSEAASNGPPLTRSTPLTREISSQRPERPTITRPNRTKCHATGQSRNRRLAERGKSARRYRIRRRFVATRLLTGHVQLSHLGAQVERETAAGTATDGTVCGVGRSGGQLMGGVLLRRSHLSMMNHAHRPIRSRERTGGSQVAHFLIRPLLLVDGLRHSFGGCSGDCSAAHLTPWLMAIRCFLAVALVPPFDSLARRPLDVLIRV